jgi:hypothetical protein
MCYKHTCVFKNFKQLIILIVVKISPNKGHKSSICISEIMPLEFVVSKMIIFDKTISYY